MADVEVAIPATQRESYTSIIDSILADSDLNTISAKRIRKGLQEQVSYDLAPQKAAITALIMERFDKVQTAAKASTGTPKRKSPPLEDSPAPKKKVKKSQRKEEETDEQIAARLQAEYDTQINARATRGGGRTKKAPLKKSSVVKKKKKSSAKVTGEDDSDLEGVGGVEKPERERKGGFHKPMNLSPALSAMVGETQLSRPQTVKKIWEYVKARDLQDPNDRRIINCDEVMRKVFKGDSVHMFTMNKLLVNHLKPTDEVIGGEIEEAKVVEESDEDNDMKLYANGGEEEPVRESETEGGSEA